MSRRSNTDTDRQRELDQPLNEEVDELMTGCLMPYALDTLYIGAIEVFNCTQTAIAGTLLN